jgi:hypothetical protein
MHVVGDIAEVDNDRETLRYCLRRIAIGPPALREASRQKFLAGARPKLSDCCVSSSAGSYSTLRATRVDGKG